MREYPNWKDEEWTFKNGIITAPCGCEGTPVLFIPDPPMTFPDGGKLQFNTWEDCGDLTGNSCVFQQKGRVHAFRTDIPSDVELYEWISGLGWKNKVE